MMPHSINSSSSRLSRKVLVHVLLVLALLAGLATSLLGSRLRTAQAAAVAVGLGSYNTTLPPGRAVPSNSAGAPVSPRRTAAIANRPMPTNDWWSSLGWERFAGNTYGDNLFAHPLSAKAKREGLGVGYSTSAGVGTEFHYGHNEALVISLAGLASPDVKVDGFSDMTVTAYFASGGNELRTTIGHGLPFVYATRTGTANALITTGGATVFAGAGTNAVGLNIGGRYFGIFGPSGSAWSQSGTNFTSNLAGQNYFSVALLPDGTLDTFTRFRDVAYNFVTNSTVSWSYNQAASRLTTTYNYTTTAREGAGSGTMIGMLRHHWLNAAAPNTAYTYQSARGQMKVIQGNSFSTTLTFNGVLPSMPNQGAGSPSYSQTTLNNYINEIYNNMGFPGVDTDTYWTGKHLNRLGQLVRIAEQMGNTAARDRFLSTIKARVEEWFRAPDGKSSAMFHYNQTWGTLIGYPASYGSDTELNDHHFHYGYYIAAAALIAQYDPAWANDANWGGMVKLLIRDANSWNRSDTLFPFLRSTDPYEGHTWAAGHAAFGAGNNMESSSESMFFNTAVFMYGAATGDTALRDFGIFLYANEVAAIEQYWMDMDNAVYPTNFTRNAVGMVWGDGGAHATWFSPEPEMIHGINMLPFNPGSVYLGRRPAYVTANWNEVVSENGGEPNQWADILWSYLALSDPAAAVTKFGSGGYTPEEGETKARTYHWIHNLNAMGQLDTGVTANIPTYNVFNKGGERTYVAYNPGGASVNVQFSNGICVTVGAGQLVAAKSSTCTSGPTATPTRTNTTGPSATPTRTSTAGGPTATRTRTSTTPPTGGCGTSNVAPGKQVLASSEESAAHIAAYAIDNNTGTRWASAFSDAQWIRVDLGSTQSICRVVLNWEAAFGRSYQIQTSNDATNWTTIYSTTTGDGGIDDLANLNGSGRYVRMNGTVRGTAYGYSLWELQIYAGGTPPPPTATRTSTAITNPPTATQPPTTGINPSTWYSLQNVASSKCVDVSGAGTANGTAVGQFACNTTAQNQHWLLVPLGDGYYRIMARHVQTHSLEVAGGPSATGNLVKTQIWQYVGGTNQQWLPQSMGTGIYRFRARHSNRCLDVPSSTTADVQLQQYDCNSSNAQNFRLIARP